MTSAGASKIFDTIRIKKLSIKCITLSANKINDDFMPSFGECLQSNKDIDTVIVEGNYISDAGIEKLAIYLDGNRTLKKLGLSFNFGITDASIPALIKIVNTSLIEYLGMYYTRITQKNVLVLPFAQNVLKNGFATMNFKEKFVLLVNFMICTYFRYHILYILKMYILKIVTSMTI